MKRVRAVAPYYHYQVLLQADNILEILLNVELLNVQQNRLLPAFDKGTVSL